MTSEAGKSLFRAANVWWRCAQYFVIASCGQMPRDNRCMYIAHVCSCVCCSDYVGVCGNVYCVAAVVKDCVFCLGVLKYVVCMCKGVMDVVFSVCMVTRGAVGARVWEV